MSIAPSKFQTNIFDFINNDKHNAVVSAVAGSGKTTTLLMSLNKIPLDKDVLFMAFNKAIAKELKDKAPNTTNISVSTVHGFGYLTLRDRKPDMVIDNFKYRKMFKDMLDYFKQNDVKHIKEYNFDHEHKSVLKIIKGILKDRDINLIEYSSSVIDLCNLGRLHYINMVDKGSGIRRIKELSDIHVIDNEDKQATVAWYLIKLGISYIEKIDFTDMIFLPNILNLQTRVYDFVFIDECQDLNICQRLLMLKAMKPKVGRFIAVGDPKQAIYAFAGADHESYKKLCSLPKTKQLPLSITYRCHSQIVDMVKHINPDIIPLSTNNDGEILRDFSYKDVQDGDMVLCRQTLPVVSLCIKYLSQGKKSYIIGGDIGLSLKNMIKSCERKTETFTMSSVFSRLYAEKAKMIVKLMENHSMSKKEATEDNHVINYNEKIQAIEVLSEKTEDPQEVIKKIEKIFSNKSKAGICLSTIHKSKGLEAERVFILQPELMPSKRAVLDWQIQQENNLRYVAYTRAKTTLGFITDYDAFKSHNSRQDDIKEVKESKHVGIIGTKEYLELKVVDYRDVTTKHGETVVYDMVDFNGNVFSKFGTIKTKFLKHYGETEVIIGSEVCFYGSINGHSEFRGTKITNVGRISYS